MQVNLQQSLIPLCSSCWTLWTILSREDCPGPPLPRWSRRVYLILSLSSKKPFGSHTKLCPSTVMLSVLEIIIGSSIYLILCISQLARKERGYLSKTPSQMTMMISQAWVSSDSKRVSGGHLITVLSFLQVEVGTVSNPCSCVPSPWKESPWNHS